MPTLFYKTKHKYHPKGGTIIEGASQTIQEEVRSIKELVQRAMQGYPIATRPVFHFDIEDINQISRFQAPHQLDLTDLDALDARIQSLQQTVAEAKARQEELKNQPQPQPTEE